MKWPVVITARLIEQLSRKITVPALLALLAISAAVHAQNYPSKPVRIIVGFAPGGASDITARILALKMGEAWGQPVIVENRPGASGIIGADIVAKAPSDGYQLLVTSQTSTAVAASLYAKLPYDVLRDFSIITVIGSTPTILVIHPSMLPRSFKEFVAFVTGQPRGLSYASSGFGSASHFAAELLGLALKTKMDAIPYKGESPALTDVIGGQLPFMFPSLPLAMPHVKAGKLRGLAVTSLQRSAIAAEYPTVAESGIAGFETASWQGLYGPAGLPAELLARINADVVKTLRLPDTNDRLTQQGIDRVASSPEQAAAYLRSELAKYAMVVKSANLRAE